MFFFYPILGSSPFVEPPFLQVSKLITCLTDGSCKLICRLSVITLPTLKALAGLCSVALIIVIPRMY